MFSIINLLYLACEFYEKLLKEKTFLLKILILIFYKSLNLIYKTKATNNKIINIQIKTTKT